MTPDKRKISASGLIAALIVLCNAIVLKNGFTIHKGWYWALLVTIPLLLTTIITTRRKTM